MKKLSSDIIVKMLILLCFAIFYFKIIWNNEIIRYVHPRIIPFAILGMITMFVIAVFLITDRFNMKKRKIRFKNYIFFIIPIIMMFFMQSTSANSSIKADDISTNITLYSNNSKIDSSLQETLGNDQDEADNLYRQNNIIEVNTDNFVSSIDKLIDNVDDYKDQEIEITGFVYKNASLKSNEFIVGRFVMACCAADLQVEGIKCDINGLNSYDSDTWVKLSGKIKTETVNYEVEPVIVVEHIEKDPNPNTQYLYPF